MLFIILFSLIALINSVPVRDIARDVRSDMVLVENPNAITKNGIRDNSFNPEIPNASGGALDLFYRYGFFSLSVRVVPRDDPGSWLVREPTASIFDSKSVVQRQEMGPGSYEPYFQVFLCDDNNELLEAYFKDFKAEGVSQPYKLYTSSWRTSTMAKYMGLSEDSLDGDSSFVLVKLMKRNRVIRVEGNPKLSSEAQKTANAIQDQNIDSVLEFVHIYGSHYVKELVLGDVVYQVFAMTNDQYSEAKRALQGVNRVEVGQFKAIYQDILAPWRIRETSVIKAASGDFQLQRFLEDEPKILARFGSYPNIFEFQNNPNLMVKLEALSASEAVIGMQFSSLRFLVPSIKTREYYDEVIDTQTALWEVNI